MWLLIEYCYSRMSGLKIKETWRLHSVTREKILVTKNNRKIFNKCIEKEIVVFHLQMNLSWFCNKHFLVAKVKKFFTFATIGMYKSEFHNFALWIRKQTKWNETLLWQEVMVNTCTVNHNYTVFTCVMHTFLCWKGSENTRVNT